MNDSEKRENGSRLPGTIVPQYSFSYSTKSYTTVGRSTSRILVALVSKIRLTHDSIRDCDLQVSAGG
jgi:hypothetical protein